MGGDFNNEMLKTISLGEVFCRCEGPEVGLEAIYVELLDYTGVEVPTGNIVLVMLEHFIGTAERSSKLGGQEGFGERKCRRERGHQVGRCFVLQGRWMKHA